MRSAGMLTYNCYRIKTPLLMMTHYHPISITHWFYVTLILAFGALLVVGCQSEAHEVSIEERDGVLHIRNAGPGLWADRDASPIAFDLEQTYGADDGTDAMLGDARTFVADDTGYLYVFDRQTSQLKSFAPDGTLRWTAGREGEGPGEFQNTFQERVLALDGTDLYVLHQMGTRIEHFDTDGSYIDSYPVGEDIQVTALVGISSKGYLLLAAPIWGRVGEHLYRFDLDTQTIVDDTEIVLHDDPVDEEGLAHSAGLTVHGDSLVGRLGIGQYALWSLDASGTPARTITREVDYMVGVGRYDMNGGFRIRGYSTLKGPFVLPSGHWLAFTYHAPEVRDPDEQLQREINENASSPTYRATIDLFDSDGRFLDAMVWEDTQTPDIGEPAQMDAEGRLYTIVEEPYPQLRRYAVRVATPQ